jgi:hypothetical protein
VGRPLRREDFPTVLLLLQHIVIDTGRTEDTVSQFVLRSCCFAIGVFSHPLFSNGYVPFFMIQSFSRYATIYIYVIPFYLNSVLVHTANCVKTYKNLGMKKSAQ